MKWLKTSQVLEENRSWGRRGHPLSNELNNLTREAGKRVSVRHRRKTTCLVAVKEPQVWRKFGNDENYKVHIGDSQQGKILKCLKSQAKLNF